MEIRVDETRPQIWERLTRQGAWQQHWAYGAACEALGSKVLRFEFRDGARITGAAQAIHRRVLGCFDAVVCTRGPVWTEDADPGHRSEVLAALRRRLPFGRLRGFFTTPDAGDEEKPVLASARLAQVMTPYATATIDLTRPLDALRAAMHQKWRNRLVAAEAAGLRIGRADKHPRLYHWLLEAEHAQQKANRYQALPVALVPAWQSAGGGVRVLTATHEGEIVAAMLFLIHGHKATYHIGWSDRTGKRLNAHNLLLWSAIRKLKGSGLAELDLGGLNTEDIPGIARFKLGSGAEVKTLCGTWFGR